MAESFKTENVLAEAFLKSQKKDRFWRNVRSFITLIMAVIFLFVFLIFFGFVQFNQEDPNLQKNHVALVRLDGYIFSNADFSAENVVPALNSAFADKKAKGVVLLINSGGGSPVQASIIYDKVNRLKEKYDKRVVVIAEDIMASGAYLVAMGGDEVYANADSIVGSIGVVMEGFGFSDVIEKLGVSRRVLTAGENKVRMDAYQPLAQKDVDKMNRVLEAVHQDFIDIVKSSRGDRLNGDEKMLFSGDFWTGRQALALGLIDGLGNFTGVIKDEFDAQYFVDYSYQPSFFDYLAKQMQTRLNLSLKSQTAMHIESSV